FALFFFRIPRRPQVTPLFPYTTLFRSDRKGWHLHRIFVHLGRVFPAAPGPGHGGRDAGCRSDAGRRAALERSQGTVRQPLIGSEDRKSTRLNSSHVKISYAVFCLKKKN